MWTRRRLGWLSWLIIIWFYEISWDHDENKNHILPLFAFVWLSRKAVTVECTERPKKLNTWINRSLRSEIWVLIFLLPLSLTFSFNVRDCFLKSPLPLLYFQQDSYWSLHIWRSCEKCKWKYESWYTYNDTLCFVCDWSTNKRSKHRKVLRWNVIT